MKIVKSLLVGVLFACLQATSSLKLYSKGKLSIDDGHHTTTRKGESYTDLTLRRLSEGYDKIVLQHSEVVLIIGKIDTGKSTFASFMTYQNLTGKDEHGSINVYDTNNRVGRRHPFTLYPELYLENKHQLAYYDIPGYSSVNDAAFETISKFFTRHVVQFVKSIRVLIAFREEAFDSSRKIISSLQAIFRHVLVVKKIKNYVQSVGLVVTFVESPPTGTEHNSVVRKRYRDLLQTALKDLDGLPGVDGEIKEAIVTLIKHLVNNYEDIILIRRVMGTGSVYNLPTHSPTSVASYAQSIKKLKKFSVQKEGFVMIKTKFESKKKEIKLYARAAVAKLNKFVEDIQNKGRDFFQHLKASTVDFKMSRDDFNKWSKVFFENLEQIKSACTYNREYCFNTMFEKFWQMEIYLPFNLLTKIKRIYDYLLWIERHLRCKKFIVKTKRMVDKLKYILDFIRLCEEFFRQLHKFSKKKSEANFRQSIEKRLSTQKESCCGNYVLEKKIYPKVDKLKAIYPDTLPPGGPWYPGGYWDDIIEEVIYRATYRGMAITCYKFKKNYAKVQFESNYIAFETLVEYFENLTVANEFLCGGNNSKKVIKHVEIFSLYYIDINREITTDLYKLRNVARPVELAIVSPKWMVPTYITLSLNGQPGADSYNPSYCNHGENGIVGGVGQTAAAFFGIGEIFEGTKKLTIESIGGRGGDASPGCTGYRGIDGKDRKLTLDQCRYIYSDVGFGKKYGWGWCRDDTHRYGYRMYLEYVWGMKRGEKYFHRHGHNFYRACAYFILGLAGTKGGDGGDGAVGGFGGKGNKIDIISVEHEDHEIIKSSHDGERGKLSCGGDGGQGGYRDCSRIMLYINCDWSYYAEYCNIDQEEWGFSLWINGDPGRDGIVEKDLQEPAAPEDFDKPYKVVNDYKYFLRANLKNAGARNDILEFYYKLERHKHIQKRYTCTGLMADFILMEYQFVSIRIDPNITDLYISLKKRTVEKMGNVTNFMEAQLCKSVITSVENKLLELQHSTDRHVSLNVERSLIDMNATIIKYKKLHIAERKRRQVEDEIKDLKHKFDQTQAQINKFKSDFVKDINGLRTQLNLVMDEMKDSFKDINQPRGVVAELASKFLDVIRIALSAIVHILPAFSEGKFLKVIELLLIHTYALFNRTSPGPTKVFSPPPKDVAWREFTELTDEDMRNDLVNVTNVKKAFSLISEAVLLSNDDREKQTYNFYLTALNSMPAEPNLSNHYRLREMVQYSLRVADGFTDKRIFNNILNIFNPLSQAHQISIMSSTGKRIHKLITDKNLIYHRIIPALSNFSQEIDTIDFMNITTEQLEAHQFENRWIRMAKAVTTASQPFSQAGKIRSLCAQVEFLLYQMIGNGRSIRLMKTRLEELSRESYLVDDGIEAQLDDAEARDLSRKMKLIVQRNKIFHEYEAAVRSINLIYFPFDGNFLVDYEMLADDSPEGMEKTDGYKLNEFIARISNKVDTIIKNYTALKASDSKLPDRMKEKYFDFNFVQVDNSPFFTWRYDVYSKSIDSLLEGKEEYFYADIRAVQIDYEVIKFREIGIKFSSKMFNTNEEEETCRQAIEKIRDCHVKMISSGDSLYRCNGKIYHFTTGVIELKHSLGALEDDGESSKHKSYQYENGNYTSLKEEAYLLSPYTMWAIQLECNGESRDHLQRLKGLVDMHLHGLGSYMHKEDTPAFIPYLRNDLKLVEPVL